jgi:hypothetical protein
MNIADNKPRKLEVGPWSRLDGVISFFGVAAGSLWERMSKPNRS